MNVNNPNMRISTFLPLLLLLVLANACVQNTADSLPILGQTETVNGETIYHSIPDFSFVNQDSQTVTNANFAGKAYVVDFFFISCPTICPKMTKQMLRVHDQFAGDDRLLFLSHSIDTKYDTIPRLKSYAENLGVSSVRWHFVTGEKDQIYEIADDYFSIALEDPSAPGGYDHSGRLILIDENRHIRSFCDGTDPKAVDKFMEDIGLLLAEMGD
jgi:protein SCO1/2